MYKIFSELPVNFNFSLCDISTKNNIVADNFLFFWNIQLPCQISKWASEFLMKFRWNFSWMVPNIFDVKTFRHFWNKLFKRIAYCLFEHGTLKLRLSDDFKGNESYLICWNSLKIRSEIWERLLRMAPLSVCRVELLTVITRQIYNGSLAGGSFLYY